MFFTFLGKIVAAVSVLGGGAVFVLAVAELTRPGQPPLDPTNPAMVMVLAGGSLAVSLIIFGLLLGVFCEISSNIRRLKVTA